MTKKKFTKFTTEEINKYYYLEAKHRGTTNKIIHRQVQASAFRTKEEKHTLAERMVLSSRLSRMKVKLPTFSFMEDDDD